MNSTYRKSGFSLLETLIALALTIFVGFIVIKLVQIQVFSQKRNEINREIFDARKLILNRFDCFNSVPANAIPSECKGESSLLLRDHDNQILISASKSGEDFGLSLIHI